MQQVWQSDQDDSRHEISSRIIRFTDFVHNSPLTRFAFGIVVLVLSVLAMFGLLMVGPITRNVIIAVVMVIVFSGLIYGVVFTMKMAHVNSLASTHPDVFRIADEPPGDLPEVPGEWTYAASYEVHSRGQEQQGFNVLQKIGLTVWTNGQGSRLIQVPVQKKMKHAISTSFGSDARIGVTTANYREINNFPSRPGVFVECFPDASIEELEQHHTEAMHFIGRRFNTEPQERNESFDHIVAMESREQALFVKSIRGWVNKSIWWELGRGKLDNISVAERWADLSPESLDATIDAWMIRVAEIEEEIESERQQQASSASGE